MLEYLRPRLGIGIEMKKLIVVAKYFYPLKNARSIQATLFIKTLCENYKVTIITSTANKFKEIEYKNLTVIRVDSKVLEQNYSSSFLIRLYKKIRKELSVTLLSGWSKGVALLLEEMMKEGECLEVITLSEPFDSHLAALSLKKKYNFNWHCFYSDPWPHSIMPKPYSNSALPLISILQEKISKSVLESADSLLFTNGKVSNYLEEKLSIKIKHKARIIRHLCDDVSNLKLAESKPSYFIHIGHLSKERVSEAFFGALVDSLKDCNIDKIMLVGRICPEMIKLISEKKWGAYFELKGELAQKEALALALNSSALLLLEAKMKSSPFVPSKLAEYFHLNVPIICLTNSDSEAGSLIKSVGNGVVVEHDMACPEMFVLIKEIKNKACDEMTMNKSKAVFSSDTVLNTIGEII